MQMGIGNRSAKTGAFLPVLIFPLLVLIVPFQYCSATDSITQLQPLSVGQTLISAGQIFELGFFSPGSSRKRYIGIWYKNDAVRKILWVANRENPINISDSGSSLIIGNDKNLRLVDGKQNTMWSTNVSVQSNSSIAVLADNGNFILRDSVSGWNFWEGFNYPCDVFLPGMMIGLNYRTGVKRFLSSWIAEDDPSTGNFVAGLGTQKPPQSIILNGSELYWRGGPWNGGKFIGVEYSDEGYSSGLVLVSDNQQGTAYLTSNIYNSSYSVILVITPAGSLQRFFWDEAKRYWFVTWEAPHSPCDVYGTCGPFGVCYKNRTPICECLIGFKPKSNEEWSKRNWTSGCTRSTELQCEKNFSSLSSKRTKSDGFLKLNNMKLPDDYEYLFDIMDPQECENQCLSNCSCLAYASVTGIECMIWGSDFTDVQQFSNDGPDLFLRLAHSELGEGKKSVKLVISLTTVFGALLLGVCIYVLHKWKTNRRGITAPRTHSNGN